jgi:hypothetical protein
MTQSKLAQAAALLTCVREVPNSDFSWDTNYPDMVFAFLSSVPQADTGIVP